MEEALIIKAPGEDTLSRIYILEDICYNTVSYSQRSVQCILADPNWTKGKQSVLDAVAFSLEYMKSKSVFLINRHINSLLLCIV